jgi:cysteinyl-tRNA synthetase
MLFSEEALAAAGRALRTLRVARVPEALNSDATNQEASGLMERFAEFLEDDFNSPGAIGVLFDTAHAVNRASLGSSHRAALQAAFETMIDVLGIPLTAEDAPTREVAAVPFIELLVRVRSELRSERQWALADRVRDGLKVLGVLLEDSSQGTSWRMEDRDAPEA